MSGLFDKGTAGEARLSSASMEDDLDLAGFDPSDLLSTLEKDSCLNLDVFSMDEELGKSLLNEGSENLLDMEDYMDLSALLGGVPGGLEDSPMVTLDAKDLEEIIMVNPNDQIPVTEGVMATKRTAEEAFSGASPSASNPDHDDYTFKRPRVATADSTVEMGEVSRPSTSTSPAPSCSSTSEPVSTVSTTEPGATKYVERRIKNNIASRRSRQTRKQKFVDMEIQAEQLEIANEKLQEQVVELEKLTKIMKDILVKKLVAKGSSWTPWIQVFREMSLFRRSDEMWKKTNAQHLWVETGVSGTMLGCTGYYSLDKESIG